MAVSLPVKLGIIGGSGIYQMPGVELVKEHAITTPFGDSAAAELGLQDNESMSTSEWSVTGSN